MRTCSGFYDLKSGSIVVCHYAMGLSFLALILLSSKLYEVDRQVRFLHVVLTEWFPPPPNDAGAPAAASTSAGNRAPTMAHGTPVGGGAGRHGRTDTAQQPAVTVKPPTLGDSVSRPVVQTKPTRLQVYVGNLKAELSFYVMELTSARTTLILSVVFVLIFILSYWWMAFAIKQARENGSVSLRTILLLSVFAAVDIAASAGFVLLRIILYVRRDRLYPFHMRTPSLAAEYDQLGSYAALRLVTLQSCCGSADILVSIVVGFLTGLRVYSVVCVFSYYRKAKNGATDSYQNNVAATDIQEREPRFKDVDEYIPRPLIINYPKKPAPQPPGGQASLARSRSRISVSMTGSTVDEELPDLKIQAADMPHEMQRAAVQSASQAIRLYSTEKHIAESIKQDFDNMFNPTWHCIVGRNWGSCVTHSKQCYIRLIFKDLTILLYKST